MAKGFIIEEVRVTGGTMRLRDSRTGKVIEVPLTVRGSLTLPGEDEADDADSEDGDTDDEVADPDDDAADDAAEAAKRKRRRRRSRVRKAAKNSGSDGATARKSNSESSRISGSIEGPTADPIPQNFADTPTATVWRVELHYQGRVLKDLAYSGNSTPPTLPEFVALLIEGAQDVERDNLGDYAPEVVEELRMQNARVKAFLGKEFHRFDDYDDIEVLYDMVEEVCEENWGLPVASPVRREDVAPTLAVPHSRPVTEDPTPVVDESTLSDQDKAAVEEFRARVSKASGRGKRGGLGWQEITVDGRSGLQARWGKGQFKILHTGGDSHALFYEWDGGKWERIACGKADDLMRLAAARAEDEQPKAPLTTLTLEVARLFCGTPDQQEAASKRLRPVRTPAEPERAARAPRKAKAEPPAEDAPRPPAGDTPSEIEVKDKELMSSFASELESVLAEEDD